MLREFNNQVLDMAHVKRFHNACSPTTYQHSFICVARSKNNIYPYTEQINFLRCNRHNVC